MKLAHPTPGSPPTPRLRVLIVDDDEMVGQVIEMILGERYEVICASEATQALAELAARPFNVVLLDYCLRGPNCTVVGERAARAGIPVVWMTGASTAMDALNRPGPRLADEAIPIRRIDLGAWQGLEHRSCLRTWRELGSARPF